MAKRIEKPSPIGLYKVWGGELLAKQKGMPKQDAEGLFLGEVWEVSSLESSVTLNIKEPLSYLFKLIDTSRPLSVQVHPGDEYARKHENTTGKSECWYILNAEENSHIYLGFKAGVELDLVEKAVHEKEDISELMNSYPVRPGDFITVPAGTIHAIGPGVTLAEVQQPSGVTYRFWDWGRIGTDGKTRELHIRQAFDVLKLQTDARIQRRSEIKDDPGILWAGPGFSVKKIEINSEFEHREQLKKNSTIFALSSLEVSISKERESLALWESVFLHETMTVSFKAAQKSKELQCLIIEPRD